MSSATIWVTGCPVTIGVSKNNQKITNQRDGLHVDGNADGHAAPTPWVMGAAWQRACP
jgi:hypothetical protein